MSIEPQPRSNTAKGGKMMASMTWRQDMGVELQWNFGEFVDDVYEIVIYNMEELRAVCCLFDLYYILKTNVLHISFGRFFCFIRPFIRPFLIIENQRVMNCFWIVFPILFALLFALSICIRFLLCFSMFPIRYSKLYS